MNVARERPGTRRVGTAAIVTLAIALGCVIQALGWAQTSYFALTRALSHGTAKIDNYKWESRDEAYTNGHFYSVKAPGLSLAMTPVYRAAVALGADRLSTSMSDSARAGGALRWYHAGVSSSLYGNNIAEARKIRSRVEHYTPLVWMLGLIFTVGAALGLMFLVRAFADRIAPGTGTATAVTLGAATLVMPFATMLFGHVPAALLGFSCFALLWREREGPPRRLLVLLAGLLAGLAVTTEYPLALVAAVCIFYAALRPGLERSDRLGRGAAFAAGALAGVLPVLIFNQLVFGNFAHNTYDNAVAQWGLSGHDKLGLNASGFFGIGMPQPHVVLDLLFSAKGLFVLSPVLVLGIVGMVLMHRDGKRHEAWTLAAICAAFLLYNAGYWLPFGGGSPGPRFLIPALPFLVLPIAAAWRRLPATTLALAIPSILTMLAATLTLPMIGNGDTGLWVKAIYLGNFEHTIFSVFGWNNGWNALAPVLAIFALSFGLTAWTLRGRAFAADVRIAVVAAIAWAFVAAVTWHTPANTTGRDHDAFRAIMIALVASLAAVGVAYLVDRKPWARRSREALEGAT